MTLISSDGDPLSSVVEALQRQVEAQPDKLLYAFLDIDGHITESVT